MKELTELVTELTLLARTARAYLELSARKDGIVPAAEAPKATKPTAIEQEKVAAPVAEKAVGEAPKRRGRPPVVASTSVLEAMGEPEPTQAVSTMSEKESLDVAYKLAAEYISKGEKETRIKELREYIKQEWNAGNISGLKHPQRVAFIDYLKTQNDAPVEALA